MVFSLEIGHVFQGAPPTAPDVYDVLNQEVRRARPVLTLHRGARDFPGAVECRQTMDARLARRADRGRRRDDGGPVCCPSRFAIDPIRVRAPPAVRITLSGSCGWIGQDKDAHPASASPDRATSSRILDKFDQLP